MGAKERMLLEWLQDVLLLAMRRKRWHVDYLSISAESRLD